MQLVLKDLRKSIGVEDFSGSVVSEIGPTYLVQVIVVGRERDHRFSRGSDQDLAKSCKGVAFGCEVPIDGCSQKEQNKSKCGRASRGPKSKCPNSLILIVPQKGVGEETPKIQGQVEVAKEGHLGAALHGMLLVELVRSERRDRGLVPSVPQRDQIYRHVEQRHVERRLGPTRRLFVPAPGRL